MPNFLSHALLLTALLLSSRAPVWCWGSAGHRIVAMIAEQRLSPEARTRVGRLLFDGQFTMADVSACPDALRSAERGHLRPDEQYCVTVAGSIPKNSTPWHYIDIPISTSSKSLDPFCPNGDCIVEKIKSFAGTLRTATDDSERRAALMYLIHFVGDLYQPLHCVERKCDQGGNLEHVNFYLKNRERVDERLHTVWDTDLVMKSMRDAGIRDERLYASALVAAMKESDAARWAAEPIDEIAWEGHAIAEKHVYRGIPEQDFCGIKDQPAHAPTQSPAHPAVTDLSPEYEREGARIVRERLQRAGVRLAELIEKNLTQ